MRTPLLAILVVLVVASPARAAMMPPADRAPHAQMTAAVAAVAADFWGAPRPLRILPATGAELERATGQPNASGTAHGDTIWIHDRWLSDAVTSYETRIAICTAGVHEDGHLRGLAHSSDPRSVMFAIQRHGHVVHGCYARFVAAAKRRASKLKLARSRGAWRVLAPIVWLGH